LERLRDTLNKTLEEPKPKYRVGEVVKTTGKVKVKIKKILHSPEDGFFYRVKGWNALLPESEIV
jgi:hypothetical protein